VRYHRTAEHDDFLVKVPTLKELDEKPEETAIEGVGKLDAIMSNTTARVLEPTESVHLSQGFQAAFWII
jgi:hypothetical protein